MKVSIEATPEEWAHEKELLEAHIAELLATTPCLAKGGAPIVRKPHPARAIREMIDLLRHEYGKMLDATNDEVAKYLLSQIGKAPH